MFVTRRKFCLLAVGAGAGAAAILGRRALLPGGEKYSFSPEISRHWLQNLILSTDEATSLDAIDPITRRDIVGHTLNWYGHVYGTGYEHRVADSISFYDSRIEGNPQPVAREYNDAGRPTTRIDIATFYDQGLGAANVVDLLIREVGRSFIIAEGAVETDGYYNAGYGSSDTTNVYNMWNGFEMRRFPEGNNEFGAFNVAAVDLLNRYALRALYSGMDIVTVNPVQTATDNILWGDIFMRMGIAREERIFDVYSSGNPMSSIIGKLGIERARQAEYKISQQYSQSTAGN